MKKITLLLVIIFTFLFSNTSWGEWSYVVNNVEGSKYYYDKDRVRKSGKYLYFWDLIDYLKPLKGDFSVNRYIQLDCSIFRFKMLSIRNFKNSMGEGKITADYSYSPKEWDYPKPNSALEFMLNKVCEEHQKNYESLVVKKRVVLYFGNRGGKFGLYTEKWEGLKTEKNIDYAKYEGEIKNGLPNGQGILTRSNGEKYEGEFKDGKSDGQGTTTYPNGEKYVGELKDGKRNGQGTFTLGEGAIYVGGFKDNKFYGRGTITFPNGNKFEGEWEDGRYHGQGTISLTDGTKYVGEFKEGKIHGQGTYNYNDGAKYAGEWEDGRYHGQGTLSLTDGTKYVGEFKNNEQHGQGTYTYSFGEVFEGEFKDNEEWNGTHYDKYGNIKWKKVNGKEIKP